MLLHTVRKITCSGIMFPCCVQQQARLQQDLASSETRASELGAREQELQLQLSSREAELLSAAAGLSEQQAAQADAQMQLQMVWHKQLDSGPLSAVNSSLAQTHFLHVRLKIACNVSTCIKDISAFQLAVGQVCAGMSCSF